MEIVKWDLINQNHKNNERKKTAYFYKISVFLYTVRTQLKNICLSKLSEIWTLFQKEFFFNYEQKCEISRWSFI